MPKLAVLQRKACGTFLQKAFEMNPVPSIDNSRHMVWLRTSALMQWREHPKPAGRHATLSRPAVNSFIRLSLHCTP